MDAQARRELVSHIQNHINYPTTKKALVEECSNMAHVPEPTRRWVVEKLPDRTYDTSAQVMKALEL